MDFDLSPRVSDLRDRVRAFMEEHVLPVELEALRALDDEVRPGTPYPQIIVDIRAKAREAGLWNLFMPDERYGAGLTNWEYGIICEETGRSPAIAPMAFNCSAPDTGNMEILAEHGTEEQRAQWLVDGEWVLNGHKWFTSGAVGASVAIVMCVTDPDAHQYARASMILVPIDNPGFNLIRPVPVMGHDGGPGHCEIRYEDCRVPETSLLGPRQAGFVIAQDRLGPGRIHHCMRAIGTCERAIEMMCRRANTREAFGGKLADKQFIQDFIAKSRMEVEQARLLTLMAAWKMDTQGKREARREISMIKVVAANVVMDVLDRAIQVHGSLGMSDDTPLAGMWRFSRMLKEDEGASDGVGSPEVARDAATAKA